VTDSDARFYHLHVDDCITAMITLAATPRLSTINRLTEVDCLVRVQVLFTISAQLVEKRIYIYIILYIYIHSIHHNFGYMTLYLLKTTCRCGRRISQYVVHRCSMAAPAFQATYATPMNTPFQRMQMQTPAAKQSRWQWGILFH
jgi:hypothetical protein